MTASAALTRFVLPVRMTASELTNALMTSPGVRAAGVTLREGADLTQFTSVHINGIPQSAGELFQQLKTSLDPAVRGTHYSFEVGRRQDTILGVLKLT